MPILPSREHEIDRQIARLASPRPAERDAAVARLILAGERAVAPLSRLAPEEPPAVLLGALAVLDRLLPRRALETVLALCHHGDLAVASRALDVAAAFGDTRAIPVLRECVARPEGDLARLAVLALLRLHAAGVHEAFEPLVDVLLDESAADTARVAAIGLLARLPQKDAEPLLRRLRTTPSAALAAHIERLAPASPRPGPPARRLLRRIQTAASGRPDPPVDDPASPPALVAQLEQTPTSPPVARQIQHLLAAHGPAALPAVHNALARTDSPRALAALADILAQIGTNASVPALTAALRRLTAIRAGGDTRERARARARLHLALAARSSRIALYDLREALAARPLAEAGDLLDAATAIGDASLLPALAALAHDLPALRPLCRKTVAALVERERPRRNARVLRPIPPLHRAALDALWPKEPSRRR